MGQALRTDEGGCVPIPMRLLRTWQVARVELLSFEVVLWQTSGMGGGDRSVAWRDEGGGAYLISAPGRWRVSNLVRPVVERVPSGWLALSTGAAWA